MWPHAAGEDTGPALKDNATVAPAGREEQSGSGRFVPPPMHERRVSPQTDQPAPAACLGPAPRQRPARVPWDDRSMADSIPAALAFQATRPQYIPTSLLPGVVGLMAAVGAS